MPSTVFATGVSVLLPMPLPYLLEAGRLRRDGRKRRIWFGRVHGCGSRLPSRWGEWAWEEEEVVVETEVKSRRAWELKNY